jgi:outer membrane protein insertion porin family
MRRTPLLFMIVLLTFGWAAAQPTTASPAQAAAVRGTLIEIRIGGVTDDLRERLIRATIGARTGTTVDAVNLEAERNRILGLGTFSEVSLSIEDRGNGPILFINVRENPPIAEVRLEGINPPLEPAPFQQLLDERHLLRSGAIFNAIRAQEALASIQQAYDQEVGFPFEPPVTLDVTPVEGDEPVNPVVVTFTINESVPVERVDFDGNTVVDEAELRPLFARIANAGEFDFEAYVTAAQAVDRLYERRGFRGSGLDRVATTLDGGTLTVRLRELRISGIDATAIGVAPGDLTLGVGDLFDYDTLIADVRRLAARGTRDIRIEALPVGQRDVRLRFVSGPPESAGPVETIRLEGNTVVTDEELLALFTLGVTDTFTSELALEDFRRIQALYGERGYVILGQPDFSYDEGTYVQRIREVRVVGYEVEYEVEEGGTPRTDPTVVTRYLPDVTSAFNQNALVAGLQSVARIGAVQPVNFALAAADPAVPEEVVVTVFVREAQTRTFTPELNYATDVGLSAAVSYGDTNFLGLAHSFNGEITLQTSPLGLQLGGSVNYSIPWLYVDLLDFLEVPTSVSASLFSVVSSNQPLTRGGLSRLPFPGAAPGTQNLVPIGQYTQRDTGFAFSVGRPILENTTLRFSARSSYASYFLEPGEPCALDAEGSVVDPANCVFPDEALRLEALPQSGFSSFVSNAITYDDRDSIEFPRRGVAATARLGFGLGSDFRDPVTNEQRRYSYQQLELGARTYLLLQDLAEDFDPNHVLAFRVNLGHQFGRQFPDSRLFVVGDIPNEATQIRGYQREDFSPSRTYLTASAEYRYDFGLTTVATQTVIGIVFVDFGYASNVPGFDPYAAPLFGSAGLGMQLNLGFGGFALPPLRLDYGFSQRNPTGKLSFRLGPVF